MKEYVGTFRHEGELPNELEEAGRAVIRAAIEVHDLIGAGLLESVYEEALCHELHLNGIPFQRQAGIVIPYKGIEIRGQRLDLLVQPGVVVELKSVETILPAHERQVVSYLRSTGFKLGYLINFNVPVLKEGIKRFVNTRPKPGRPESWLARQYSRNFALFAVLALVAIRQDCWKDWTYYGDTEGDCASRGGDEL